MRLRLDGEERDARRRRRKAPGGGGNGRLHARSRRRRALSRARERARPPPPQPPPAPRRAALRERRRLGRGPPRAFRRRPRAAEPAVRAATRCSSARSRTSSAARPRSSTTTRGRRNSTGTFPCGSCAFRRWTRSAMRRLCSRPRAPGRSTSRKAPTRHPPPRSTRRRGAAFSRTGCSRCISWAPPRTGVARLAAAGCAAVWCPTSNGFLYGTTAPRALFDVRPRRAPRDRRARERRGDAARRARAARALGFLTDSRLEEAVGATARRRLFLPPPSLEPGARADVVALDAPLLEAAPRDVALVLVDGRPVLADERHAAIFDAAGVPAEALTVGGVPKRVVSPLASVAEAAFRLVPDLRRIIA